MATASKGNTRRWRLTRSRRRRGRGAGRSPPAAPEAGAARPQMMELQKALARQGFAPGRADGVFGPRTGGALNAFQRREHLPVTERPSPEALARLKGNG